MSAACSSIQHKVNGSPDWINRKGLYVIETDLEKIRTAATNCSCQDGHMNLHSRHTQNEQHLKYSMR